MTELLLMPRRIPPIDWKGVPEAFQQKLSAVCRTVEDCGNLVRWFGAANFCPELPVMVMIPGADAPTLIAGMGYADAAELQDCALDAWHKQTERLAKTGKVFDFDALRARHGLMRRENVDAAVRNAMLDRVAKHKANPVTDPFRQPVYPNPTNRTLHQKPERK